jgi:hypothetical protein
LDVYGYVKVIILSYYNTIYIYIYIIIIKKEKKEVTIWGNRGSSSKSNLPWSAFYSSMRTEDGLILPRWVGVVSLQK